MQHLNNFQPVPQPAIPSQPPPESDTAHPRRSSYAAMSDLQEQFSAAGIETEQVWEFIKAEYCVESRALFTGRQWAMIACQLQSARREPHLFKVYVDGIPDQHFRIHVYSSDASVAIGRPRDMRKHHIAAEWFDFQAFANEHQTTLTVTQGKCTTYFEPKPITQPAPVSTPENMSVTPKMSPEQHQNSPILNGIKATLKISGKWLTAPSVFRGFYDKYNLVNVHDIEIGLDGLAKADEIQSKIVDGEKQYFLPTTDFETLLNRCQVSKYHLAEVTGIDEAVMCGYCKGAEISTADAQKIADTLNIEPSELKGMCDPPAQTEQKPVIALNTNARGEVLNVFGDVLEVQ